MTYWLLSLHSHQASPTAVNNPHHIVRHDDLERTTVRYCGLARTLMRHHDLSRAAARYLGLVRTLVWHQNLARAAVRYRGLT